MQTMDISQRVRDVEALLRNRDFERALTMSVEMESALAREARIGCGRGAEGEALRERLESIRWAAQVGCRLTALTAQAESRGTAARSHGLLLA